ncbi:hypothetical protein QJQ45_014941 [Haematococcus lacustris]|nr:hypothetical protein QJQ45_014941 [Haematococcus lacustris]
MEVERHTCPPRLAHGPTPPTQPTRIPALPSPTLPHFSSTLLLAPCRLLDPINFFDMGEHAQPVPPFGSSKQT